MNTLAGVQEQVLLLSPSDQLELYNQLREKFEPVTEQETETAWDQETSRRLKEWLDGDAGSVEAAEMEARLDAVSARIRSAV